MINPRRQYQQIILLQPNPDPRIILTPHIKEPISIKDISNLLIFMQMFRKEGFHFFLVDGAHLFGADGDFIAVFVAAFAG
jgi:hypothetical protein